MVGQDCWRKTGRRFDCGENYDFMSMGEDQLSHLVSLGDAGGKYSRVFGLMEHAPLKLVEVSSPSRFCLINNDWLQLHQLLLVSRIIIILRL